MSEKKIEYEKCIDCGAKTNIPKDMHIDKRLNYIEGAGQLCNECAKKLKQNDG